MTLHAGVGVARQMATPASLDGGAKQGLWERFCAEQTIEARVPLFDVDQHQNVATHRFGGDARILLRRSAAMEALVREEAGKVVADYKAGGSEYDGLVYLMYWEDGGTILPLYIGKAEKFGKGDGNLSANIAGVAEGGNMGKFCRWGYGYAYHMGDLSAVVCPGHLPEKRTTRYARWAKRLFTGYPDGYPSASPMLIRPVWFWMRAWRRTDVGIWRDYGATSSPFLEYLLIGVAGELFPETLLNTEGVQRAKPIVRTNMGIPIPPAAVIEEQA